jgi:hypothetical protein
MFLRIIALAHAKKHNQLRHCTEDRLGVAGRGGEHSLRVTRAQYLRKAVGVRACSSTDRASLEKSGAKLAFGSDWPCTWPPDPFVSIQQAVERQVWRSPSLAALPGGGAFVDGAGQAAAVGTLMYYVPDERISVEEAVAGYTRRHSMQNALRRVATSATRIGRYYCGFADCVVSCVGI